MPNSVSKAKVLALPCDRFVEAVPMLPYPIIALVFQVSLPLLVYQVKDTDFKLTHRMRVIVGIVHISTLLW